MQSANELMDLERRFWQSIVDQDPEVAVALLDEPSVLVSPHGTMRFTRDQYREMAEHGSMEVKAFELGDMDVVFPNENTAVLTYGVRQTLSERGKSELIEQEMTDASVWTRKDGRWLCAMHAETPAGARGAGH